MESYYNKQNPKFWILKPGRRCSWIERLPSCLILRADWLFGVHPCVTVGGTEDRQHENYEYNWARCSLRQPMPAEPTGLRFICIHSSSPWYNGTLVFDALVVQCRCPCQPLNCTPQRNPQDTIITSDSKVLSFKAARQYRWLFGEPCFFCIHRRRFEFLNSCRNTTSPQCQ